MYIYYSENMLVCNYDNIQIPYLWMRLDEFLGNLVLLRLDFFKKC